MRIYSHPDLQVESRLKKKKYTKKEIEKLKPQILYVYTKLLFKYLRGTPTKYGTVSLCSTKMRKHLGRYSEYNNVEDTKGILIRKRTQKQYFALVRQLLKEWGVITNYVNIYECRTKSKVYYQLGDKFLRGYYEVTYSEVLRKFKTKITQTEQNQSLSNFYQFLEDRTKDVQLDSTEARKWLDQAYKNGYELKPKFKG